MELAQQQQHKQTWVHDFRRALLARGISDGKIVPKSLIVRILVYELGYSYMYAQYYKIKELVLLGVLKDLGRGWYLVM